MYFIAQSLDQMRSGEGSGRCDRSVLHRPLVARPLRTYYDADRLTIGRRVLCYRRSSLRIIEEEGVQHHRIGECHPWTLDEEYAARAAVDNRTADDLSR